MYSCLLSSTDYFYCSVKISKSMAKTDSLVKLHIFSKLCEECSDYKKLFPETKKNQNCIGCLETKE